MTTKEENNVRNNLTKKGAYILSAVGSALREVVPIVIAHHQYFADTLKVNNGNTLKIPLGARVITVADSFDAMTTDLPYRKGMSPWGVLEEIMAKAGKQFDTEVVEAFKRVISEKLEKL